MATQADQVVLFQAYAKERGPQELSRLPRETHITDPLLNYTRDHEVTITIPQAMDNNKIDKAVSYRSQTLSLKEKSFVRKELAEQLRTGHIGIFLWKSSNTSRVYVFPP